MFMQNGTIICRTEMFNHFCYISFFFACCIILTGCCKFQFILIVIKGMFFFFTCLSYATTFCLTRELLKSDFLPEPFLYCYCLVPHGDFLKSHLHMKDIDLNV